MSQTIHIAFFAYKMKSWKAWFTLLFISYILGVGWSLHNTYTLAYSMESWTFYNKKIRLAYSQYYSSLSNIHSIILLPNLGEIKTKSIHLNTRKRSFNSNNSISHHEQKNCTKYTHNPMQLVLKKKSKFCYWKKGVELLVFTIVEWCDSSVCI